jgi:hypothetical protein
MPTPHLHRQLSQQLRQWIVPEDRRHLEGFGKRGFRGLLRQKGAY